MDDNRNTIDVPHGDTLTTIASALGRWQAEALRLDAEMVELCNSGPGVYLDPDGKPVVPGWYERKRKDDGRHIAWYLIWPHKHARRTGCKRRQYLRAAEVEAARGKAARTREYADLAAQRARLEARIERLGRGLEDLVAEHGLVTNAPPGPGFLVATQAGGEW